MWGKNDSDEKFHDIFDIIYRYLFVICHLIHLMISKVLGNSLKFKINCTIYRSDF